MLPSTILSPSAIFSDQAAAQADRDAPDRVSLAKELGANRNLFVLLLASLFLFFPLLQAYLQRDSKWY